MKDLSGFFSGRLARPEHPIFCGERGRAESACPLNRIRGDGHAPIIPNVERRSRTRRVIRRALVMQEDFDGSRRRVNARRGDFASVIFAALEKEAVRCRANRRSARPCLIFAAVRKRGVLVIV